LGILRMKHEEKLRIQKGFKTFNIPAPGTKSLHKRLFFIILPKTGD
jgi:hypothetical protein